MLSAVFTAHPELHYSFKEVRICYDHARSAFIPIEHFDNANAKALLDIMHGSDGRSEVISEMVNEWQLYNVYAVPVDVQEWITRRFPSAKCRHHFTLGVKTLNGDIPDRLLIDIHTDEFSFIATKEDKLLIAQTHEYSSPEDILYYLLKTCHQFSLSQEKVQLQVSGLIEKESQLYREMAQFFINVDFREPAWEVPLTNGESDHPAHFFTTLNDLARCAS